MQMLDKCLRGNEIASLWHAFLASLGTCAIGVQFYCPPLVSRTYPAIPYCTIFPFIAHCAADEYAKIS